jgi:hypothetical protein
MKSMRPVIISLFISLTQIIDPCAAKESERNTLIWLPTCTDWGRYVSHECRTLALPTVPRQGPEVNFDEQASMTLSRRTRLLRFQVSGGRRTNLEIHADRSTCGGITDYNNPGELLVTIFKDDLVAYQDFVKEDYRVRSSSATDYTLYLPLPAGRYEVQFDLLHLPQHPCKVTVSRSDVDTPNNTNLVPELVLEKAALRIIETKLASLFDISRLDIYYSPRWTSVNLVQFLSKECSNKPEFDLYLDYYPDIYYGFDNWVKNEENIRRISFLIGFVRYINSLNVKLHRSEPSNLRVGDELNLNSYRRTDWVDWICGGASKDDKDFERVSSSLGEFDQKDLIAFTLGEFEIQYIVSGYFPHRAAPDDLKSNAISDLIPESDGVGADEYTLAEAVSDALRVPVTNIFFRAWYDSGGGCELEWTYRSILLAERWHSFCYTSGSGDADITAPEAKGGYSERVVNNPSLLKKAIQEVLPQGVIPEWIQEYSDSVRVKIEGTKGWVNARSSYWEKLYI